MSELQLHTFKMSDPREDAIKEIIKVIPCIHQLQRMLELSPEETNAIIRTKPMFPYSRERIENMSKAEYRAAMAKWEQDRYGPFKDDESDIDTKYQKFREWNFKCVNDMYEDELEHLSWLCDLIAKGKIRNMDMESTAAFHTGGIYFNADREIVIYNQR
jgi:hypothetical protein